MSRNTAPTGSSIGSSGGGNTASSISKSTKNTAKPKSSSTASSKSFNTFHGSGSGLGSSVQPKKQAPLGSLTEAQETRNATDIYNTADTLTQLQNQYAIILEQKMYAEVLRNLVGRETKEFDDWASSKGIQLNQAEDIEDFIDLMEQGEYTSDEKLNKKIEKTLKYIPDIIGSLAKNDAIAPGAKIIAGENPIIDEIKFGVEKVIAPALKKVGALLEKRLGTEVGKKIGASLIEWGESLATLPTRVLERVGLPDIILSVVDASLLAVDKATGNYRQQNHDFPSEILGLPVVGQYIEILSTVRDLLDSAVGIPRDDEAIPMLQQRLERDLWRPIMAEYAGVMNEFGKHEKAFQKLAQATEQQALRSVVFKEVVPRIDTIAEEFGNNKKDMREFIMNDLGIDKSQTQLVKDINKIIDFQIGKISREDLEKALTSTKVVVPEVQQVINGAEVRVRVALDNVYSSQTLITALEGSIQAKKDEIAELNKKIDDEYRFADTVGDFGGFGSFGGLGLSNASKRAIAGWRAEIQAKEAEITDLKDNEIPKITNQLEAMYADFENSLEEAQALGIDLSFLEKSKNWDQALADMEDDTMFWETVLPGGMFF